jgi:hypothetical protein
MRWDAPVFALSCKMRYNARNLIPMEEVILDACICLSM